MRYVIYFHCLLHPEEAEWRNVGVLNENIISCWCCINLLNRSPRNFNSLAKLGLILKMYLFQTNVVSIGSKYSNFHIDRSVFSKCIARKRWAPSFCKIRPKHVIDITKNWTNNGNPSFLSKLLVYPSSKTTFVVTNNV